MPLLWYVHLFNGSKWRFKRSIMSKRYRRWTGENEALILCSSSTMTSRGLVQPPLASLSFATLLLTCPVSSTQGSWVICGYKGMLMWSSPSPVPGRLRELEPRRDGERSNLQRQRIRIVLALSFATMGLRVSIYATFNLFHSLIWNFKIFERPLKMFCSRAETRVQMSELCMGSNPPSD